MLSGSLPPGLNFSINQNQAVIRGVPEDSGVFNFKVSAAAPALDDQDGNCSQSVDRRNFILLVNPPSAT